MATIIASEGALTAVADTSIDPGVAQSRYLGVTFYNSGSSTRVVSVKYGTKQLRSITLYPGKTRSVGPYALGAAEELKAWQDAGTDVNYRVSGEY